jgi:OOP family OmpA-OmpF porin
MKQQHSLDHDGLDGILQSSRKPQSKYFYFRSLWLVPILIFIAITAFWLQIYPLQFFERPENLPHSSDRITIAENESPATSVSTQSVPPSISGQSGNVSSPSPNPAETTLSDNIHFNQSPAALENQIPHARESAEAETATSKMPPVIEPVLAANTQKDKDQSTSLMEQSFKLHFKFASSDIDLSKTEKTDLTRFAQKCNNQIRITGHTCNLGSPDHNQTLGWARANALKQLLINHGVPAERIVTASKGMRNPVASNETISGRALNRRAELSCIGK